MNCFRACFKKKNPQGEGSMNAVARNKVNHDYVPSGRRSPRIFNLIEETHASKPRENNERVNCNMVTKKVTFDPNVKQYDYIKDSSESGGSTEIKEDFQFQDKVNLGLIHGYVNFKGSVNERSYDELKDEANGIGNEMDIVGIEVESSDSLFSLPLSDEKQKYNCQEADRFTRGKDNSMINFIEKCNHWAEDSIQAFPLQKPKKLSGTNLETKESVLQSEKGIHLTMSTLLISSDSFRKRELEKEIQKLRS